MHTLALINGRVMAPQREADNLIFCGNTVGDASHTPDCEYDLEGDFLIPGLVELHTDNMEKYFMPRAGVKWPAGLASVAAHDVQMIGAGVTTVFDAVTVGETESKKGRGDLFSLSLEAIRAASAKNLLRADHFIHLRCELAADDVPDLIAPYLNWENLRLISLMDHTPGQRQWRDFESYKTYHNLHALSERELSERSEILREMQMKNVRKNLRAIVDACRSLSLPLASHDDTTVEHVRENTEYGVGIAEFPTTIEAAREAAQQGLYVIMGAPNIVRGGSHSGNVSAAELAREGLLNILSSDYMPASLLHAAFMLTEVAGVSLSEALNSVTLNPAKAVGLTDRGSLAPGKRADAVQVRVVDGIPMVRAVWRGGQRVM